MLASIKLEKQEIRIRRRQIKLEIFCKVSVDRKCKERFGFSEAVLSILEMWVKTVKLETGMNRSRKLNVYSWRDWNSEISSLLLRNG